MIPLSLQSAQEHNMNRLFIVILTTLLLPGITHAHHHDEDAKQVGQHNAMLFIEPNLGEQQERPVATTLKEQQQTRRDTMQPELERR